MRRGLAFLGLVLLTGNCRIRQISVVDEVDGGGAGRGGSQGGEGGDGGNGGGGGGGAAGGGGGGAAGEAGGEPTCTPVLEMCNGLDDDCDGMTDEDFDKSKDSANCGACGNVCSFEHALPACAMGLCKVGSCLPGFVDIDMMSANGCECLITNGGVEICDGADNDCNGVVDEGVDKMTDIANCGMCGHVCDFAHASGSCDVGTCTMGACETGFLDIDKDPVDGCEYRCSPSNGGVEKCDGIDNDCDGLIDNAPVDAGMACGPVEGNKGACKLGTMLCTTATLVCTGAVYPALEFCDGKDNDCDDMTDEGFDKVGDIRWCGNCSPCNLAHAVPSCVAGACTVAACSPGFVDLDADPTNGCEYPCTFRGPDVCNGQDDDCNGVTDDAIDKTTDPSNCGACGTVCAYSHATPLCTASACAMGACDSNFYDRNASDVDGCESFCVPAGAEACDSVDNDCDGLTDEGFDTATDPLNCGGCGRACGFSHAASTCTAGVCGMGACLVGYRDINGLPVDGCEYGCTVSNGGAEICDGKDNDCNGATDEDYPEKTGSANRCYPAATVGCDVAAGTCVGRCAFGAYGCFGGALVCQTPVTPRSETCNLLDDNCDGATDDGFAPYHDPRFCGSCGTPCSIPHAVAACPAGTCTIASCVAGWRDDPAKAGPDCDYNCTPTGPEVCDGLDNDCDKLIDNADPGLLFPSNNFCKQRGECGSTAPGGSPLYLTCSNNAARGCTATGPCTAAGTCNLGLGTCTGNSLVSCSADAQCAAGTCTGPSQKAFPTCVIVAPATSPDWVCNYNTSSLGVELTGPNLIVGQETWCDGKDNDCDGSTDEGETPAVGGTCSDSGVGECKRFGTIQCVAADKTAAPTCVLGATVPAAADEICDGKDNDCDGLTDESWDNANKPSLPTCAGIACKGVRDAAVHVTAGGKNYYMYQYEASRPDATGATQGTATARACSRKPSGGVLPWTFVNYAQARAACTAAGMRLCSTTRAAAGCNSTAITADEWGFACSGNQTCTGVPQRYPYACTYNKDTCNGTENTTTGGALTQTGALAGCATGDLTGGSSGFAWDMSGNVAEWTDDCRTTLADGRKVYTLRGGGFDNIAPGLTCTFMSLVAAENFSFANTGFRCCSVCAAGQAECSGTCKTLSSDAANCGACGVLCSGGTPNCRNGACAP